jgi:ferredoxin-type protein NapG
MGRPPAPAGLAAPRYGRGQALPLLRPPGAIAEEAFLAACTRCDECIRACPHAAIVPAAARCRGAIGTPVLNLPDAPCRMCADFPCIAACPTAALRADIPAGMGTARISPLDCLAHQNNPCSACVEQCLVPDAIIWENSRPTVRPDVCTGCGVCQHVCPAPRNAVIVLPRRHRPHPAEGDRHD